MGNHDYEKLLCKSSKEIAILFQRTFRNHVSGSTGHDRLCRRVNRRELLDLLQNGLALYAMRIKTTITLTAEYDLDPQECESFTIEEEMDTFTENPGLLLALPDTKIKVRVEEVT